MVRKPYDSDITDVQWLLLEPLVPAAKTGGRPRSVDLREICNGIFYVLRAGCAWRLLPHDLPPWPTVYGYFRAWQQAGVWETFNAALRDAVREQVDRAAEPSAAIMDSQSVKSARGAGERGFDAAKHINGRKRHILVDVLGLLLEVIVTKADVPERAGGQLLLQRASEHFRHCLALIWADGGYSGAPFSEWVAENFGWVLEIVKRSDDAQGFVVLPRRWVVERTFGWLMHFRRLCRDYEGLTETSEAWIYAAMVKIMLQRLAADPAIYM